MAEVNYLDASKLRFRLTAGGILTLEIEDKLYPKVDLFLAFPFTWPDRYISVREPEGDEIGMVREISDLDKNSQEAVRQELQWRYYAPKITRIKSYKEEFGHSYWSVETDRGPQNFVTGRRDQSVRSISPTRVLLVDVSGNRFEIPDVRELDGRSRYYLETLL
ncbi:MAG: DUF1854 domain-containing protein [Firmicutes bacterium]|jgi:hypothetical protein|nr:DUF1854 domain-containing protein [Bacillota bacterium]NLO66020.1 DUF1854 domain-containing protein [Bacillota bacterium]